MQYFVLSDEGKGTQVIIEAIELITKMPQGSGRSHEPFSALKITLQQ